MSVEGFQTASSPCGSSPQKHPKIDSGTPPGHLIAYVHEVTPLKRNRSNRLDYFNLTLQCSSAKNRGICFSRAKRKHFVERRESKTAVKLQRFTLAKDGETIFVNDMTKVSSPNSSEYNFQYQDIDYPVFDSLTAVVENAVDMEQISCCAKVVFRGNQVEGIGASEYKKVDCYIAVIYVPFEINPVGRIHRHGIRWRSLHIQTSHNTGELRRRKRTNSQYYLTPIQTVITQAENLSDERRCAFNDVALLEADGENHKYMEPNIDNIDSIEELRILNNALSVRKKFSKIIQVLSQSMIIAIVLSEATLVKL